MGAVEAVAVQRIVALQGASTATIQGLLADFADKLTDQGLRVAGVIEIAECAEEGACKQLAVRDLASGASFSISQDLGAGSTACNLNPGGLAKACGLVETAIAAGADVVILSKFGKLEAARGGLCDAFRAAILADLPIITAVSPALSEEWSRFAGPLADYMVPRADRLDAWWRLHSHNGKIRVRSDDLVACL